MYVSNVSENPATSVFKEEVPATLKMKALNVSEMLTAIYKTTQHIILENGSSETKSQEPENSLVCMFGL